MPDWIEPAWRLPAGVRAVTSTRQGGVSDGKHGSMNLARNVGDDDLAVGENRIRFENSLPGRPEVAWLSQVHGDKVVAAHKAIKDEGYPEADASWTDQLGIACVVTTADCVPVLLAADNELRVAAIHAGWRGLVARIIPAVAEGFLADGFTAYIGPCISQARYQVGDEVRKELLAVKASPDCFAQNSEGKNLANLVAVAAGQLQEAGVREVVFADVCTYSESRMYYSARRDGRVSGRFASAIWLESHG